MTPLNYVTVTVAEFRTAFPEFASTADSKVERVLTLARQMYALGKEPLMHVAAHLLVIDQDTGFDGGSGEVSKAELDRQITEYMTQARENQETFFTRSGYGRMALTLMRRTPGTAVAGMLAVN